MYLLYRAVVEERAKIVVAARCRSRCHCDLFLNLGAGAYGCARRKRAFGRQTF